MTIVGVSRAETLKRDSINDKIRFYFYAPLNLVYRRLSLDSVCMLCACHEVEQKKIFVEINFYRSQLHSVALYTCMPTHTKSRFIR